MTTGTLTKTVLVCLAVIAGAAGVRIFYAGQDVPHTVNRPAEPPAIGPDRDDTRMLVVPAAGQTGSSKTIDVMMMVLPTPPRTATSLWQNTAFGLQSASFLAEFDAVPAAASIDGVTALSAAPIASPDDCAVAVRFAPAGTIQARNGDTYAALTPVPYAAGTTYHFRLVVNVPAHTYSAYVTPAGAAEQTLAMDYVFRAGQASLAGLGNWGLQAAAGAHTVTDFQLSVAPLLADAGPARTVPAGGATTLAASAGGGLPPYTYSWSPAADLSSATASNPTASPAGTTTYTLTVRDATGRTATDRVIVTVTSGPVPLTAGTSGNVTITAGGVAALAAWASGGTAPYSYSWAPTPGLNNSAIANPIAIPTSTTTYTLTVRDATAATASDIVVVTVNPPGTGPTWYVSPDGDDGNDGSPAAPWRTLARAAGTVTAGATVIVRAGTYTETLRPANSGTAGDLVTFRSETKGAAVIDGQRIRSFGVDLTASGSYVRIDGFEIRNHTVDGVVTDDWYSRNSRGFQIRNCYIHDNAGDALNLRNSQDALVEANDITNNGQTAIAMGGLYGSANLVIRANKIHHNVKDGIQGNSTNLLAEYNQMYDQYFSDAHQDAFQLDSYDGVTIRYNLIGDFTQLVYGGLDAGVGGACLDLKVYGNVFYNAEYWRIGGPDGANGTCPAVFIATIGSLPGSTFAGVEIHSNTFLYLGDGQKPIMLYGDTGIAMSDVRIYDNIFYQCRGSTSGYTYDIDSRFSNVRIDYNCYYNMLPYAGQDTHGIVGNPRLVSYTPAASTFDVRLLPGSPCINAGAPNLGNLLTVPGAFVDVDGTPRPSGGNFDMGAYEAP